MGQSTACWFVGALPSRESPSEMARPHPFRVRSREGLRHPAKPIMRRSGIR
jgi:hypothetical protein